MNSNRYEDSGLPDRLAVANIEASQTLSSREMCRRPNVFRYQPCHRWQVSLIAPTFPPEPKRRNSVLAITILLTRSSPILVWVPFSNKILRCRRNATGWLWWWLWKVVERNEGWELLLFRAAPTYLYSSNSGVFGSNDSSISHDAQYLCHSEGVNWVSTSVQSHIGRYKWMMLLFAIQTNTY